VSEVWFEPRRSDVLGVCHSRRLKEVRGRLVRTFRCGLTYPIGTGCPSRIVLSLFQVFPLARRTSSGYEIDASGPVPSFIRSTAPVYRLRATAVVIYVPSFVICERFHDGSTIVASIHGDVVLVAVLADELKKVLQFAYSYHAITAKALELVGGDFTLSRIGSHSPCRSSVETRQ
jgi:hypothetical protein